MKIKEEIINQITAAAKIDEVVSAFETLKKSGSSFRCKCGKCMQEKKMSLNRTKNVAKCFSCGDPAVNPIGYLMQYQNMDYPTALKYLADKYNIVLEHEEKAKRTKPSKRASKKASFRDIQLQESGIGEELQRCYVKQLDSDKSTNTQKEVDRYEAASINQKWEIVPGDDMILHYIDLEGYPMTYYKKNRHKEAIGSPLPFFRIRYQHPELHPNKEGKAAKYKTPFGAESNILWIPNIIRNKYASEAKIKTLYVCEGEKKADKASEAGLFAVGVTGIHNVAPKKALSSDFTRIIKRNKVENIVFLLDADWKDISYNEKDKSVDTRPKSFFSAVKTFRKAFYGLTNSDIYLNMYFAYIKQNEANDKGIDDLIVNTLKGKSKSLFEDAEYAIRDANGRGNYLQFHDITTITETKLKDLWHLNSKNDFFNGYKSDLKDFREFSINGVKYRINEKNELEQTSPILEDEKFWRKAVKTDAEGEVKSTSYTFRYPPLYTFLERRGFWRFKADEKSHYVFLNSNNIVKKVDAPDIKDYTVNFTKALEMPDVLQLIYSGGSRYLGPDSMSNLSHISLDFHLSGAGFQHLYFNDKFWKVTKNKIQEFPITELDGYVWEHRVKTANVTLLDPLVINTNIVTIEQAIANNVPQEHLNDVVGMFEYELTEIGEKCDFLKYLLLTSNYHHREKELTIAQQAENSKHFLAKVTALGYMSHTYRDENVLKAVVCMDSRESEVGESNGRTGKSLLGMAMEQLLSTVVIDGKQKEMDKDQFLWEEVDSNTDLVFIDDVRVNFDIEAFFNVITGRMKINSKGAKKFTLKREDTPKFIISTNHALNGDGDSFRDRQHLLGFSDYFSATRKPKDEFGSLFFSEWGHGELDQWNLFYNLQAFCIQTYFKYGLVAAPDKRLMKRKQRQSIGETFISWADEFFTKDNYLNREVSKIEAYKGLNTKSFLACFPKQERYINIRIFKKKLIEYCEFRNYIFNPNNANKATGLSHGGNNKKSGVEFILISDGGEITMAELPFN